ncbi:hypothetical protein O6P43_003634 [Quillaja saponaria]|uniref:Uncharacterized protein n=1 Tax=Quillaja saponaria TaxID=32244 RepID=A0AAD7VLS4_QUISA|nr:hypothetical protein O6P43_003634 [Quillaja saponaria]
MDEFSGKDVSGVYYRYRISGYCFRIFGSVGYHAMTVKCIIGQRACYLELHKSNTGGLKRVRVKEVLRTSLEDDDNKLEDDDDGYVLVRFVMEEDLDHNGCLWYKMVEHSGDDSVVVSEGSRGLYQGVSFTDNYSKRDCLLHFQKIQDVGGLVTRVRVRYFYLFNKKGFFLDVEIDSNADCVIKENWKGLDILSSNVYDDMKLRHRSLLWRSAATPPEHNQLSRIYPFPHPYSQPSSYSNNYDNSGTQNQNGLTNSTGFTRGNLNHAVFRDYQIHYNVYR